MRHGSYGHKPFFKKLIIILISCCSSKNKFSHGCSDNTFSVIMDSGILIGLRRIASVQINPIKVMLPAFMGH